jgi:tetratricopeptide (TPR) repeat protein
MMKKVCLLFIAVVFFALDSQAQLQTPAPSPGAKLTQTVGLTEVTVEYSRPSMKDRAIFGDADALVEFGKIWRAGANQATKISFSKDVKVGDADLKAGSYAILTMPGKSEWGVMFYTYETGNFGSYVEKEPTAKVMAKTGKLSRSVESFTIDINNLRNNTATIDLMWENTVASIPLTVHTDKEVTSTFETMMAGPTTDQYYAMGTYLLQSGKDLEKALTYIQKATKEGEPRFWQVHQEALALGELGRYKEATAAAKKSIELAKVAKNDDYVKLNEKAMASWKKKM